MRSLCYHYENTIKGIKMKQKPSIKPVRTSTTIRLSPSLLKQLKLQAEKDGRSLNGYVVHLLTQAA